MIYHPDKWIVVTIKSSEGTYNKVLASWYGSFGGSDSWQLSSAIVSVEVNESHYTFNNESGSQYICNREAYGTSSYTNGILQGWMTQAAQSDDVFIEVNKDYGR